MADNSDTSNGDNTETVTSADRNGNDEDEDEEVRQFQESCRQEMEQRLSNLQGNFRLSFNEDEFSGFAENFHKESRVQIAHRQVDVLRANKIFRDVARFIGNNDWRPMFHRLVESLPEDVVSAELTRIEREKTFMQPYKALTVWKELSGDNFRIDDLVDALNACELYDLADKTRTTLQSEGDSLYSLSDFGKSRGTSTGTSATATAASRKLSSSGSSDTNQSGVKAPLSSQTSVDTTSTSGAASDGLGDGQLLKLARKIGGSWVSLGKTLNLPSDQVKEIWDKEGDTYQGAFQMLWAWRDNTSSMSLPLAIGELSGALDRINRTDLAEEVKKW